MNRSRLEGYLWFFTSLFISAINDVLVKYVSSALPPLEVSFFRFFFGTISLLPLVFFYGLKSIETQRSYIHIARGILLFIGISLWTYGLKNSQVVVATIVSFTIPFFTLLLARFFLKEQVSTKLWIVTIIGFLGVIITTNPQNMRFDLMSTVFVVASLIFAIIDIINKKYSNEESMLSMLFYSCLITAVLGLITVIPVWQMPRTKDLILLSILGTLSNAILFCIIKAFRTIEVSKTSVLRYFELIISVVLAYFIFGYLPNLAIYLGALIIIPCSFYIERNKNY